MEDFKYHIVLFKNRNKKKVLKKYKNKETAINFFNKKIKSSSNILFDIRFENGEPITYELAILENNPVTIPKVYKKDSLGRNILIEADDPTIAILMIEDIKIQEKIYDISKNKKLTLPDFKKKYLNSNELKLISKLNNKIVFQVEDYVKLFSCKCESDAERFINTLSNNLTKNEILNTMLVKDNDVAQKKYLYELLENKGFDKKMLYRKSTTHLK